MPTDLARPAASSSTQCPRIFNYLLPGVLFAVFADAYTSYGLVQDDALVGAFVYYFIGLLISRVGSLILEPALKAMGLLELADHDRFLEASELDEGIATLSEQNNTYQTLSALFLCLLGLLAIEQVGERTPYVLAATLLIFFAASYRKQTMYVVKHVNRALSKKPN